MICGNIPPTKGSERIEEQIKEAIEVHSGEKVVGVSACWNYHHHTQEVMSALEEELGSVEGSPAVAHHRQSVQGSRALSLLATSSAEADPGEEQPGIVRRAFDWVNRVTL